MAGTRAQTRKYNEPLQGQVMPNNVSCPRAAPHVPGNTGTRHRVFAGMQCAQKESSDCFSKRAFIMED